DTFGWRFYPRFQTEGKLDESSVESGVRECEALIILPSFLSQLELHSRSRWFSLAHPNSAEMPFAKIATLSDKVAALRSRVEKPGNQSWPGDMRYYQGILPFKNLSIRVPYENSLGGFALFNPSSAGLAPELYTFYGTPAL